MPVWLGICEEKNKKKVVDHIVKDIIDNNYHLTCGNQGYRHVFYLLCEYGHADLAIKVLENPEYPGWGYMLEKGATTVWERWEAEMQNEMHSFDRPMFGSYDAIFYRYFLGIQVGGNGADDIRIEPIIPNSLTYAKGEFKSIKGTISSSWVKEKDKIRYSFLIPGNTSAKIKLMNETLTINGKEISEKEFTLQGGRYEITTKI